MNYTWECGIRIGKVISSNIKIVQSHDVVAISYVLQIELHVVWQLSNTYRNLLGELGESSGIRLSIVL